MSLGFKDPLRLKYATPHRAVLLLTISQALCYRRICSRYIPKYNVRSHSC
jgi:hypothetical protein